jgi:hypothetical protein
MYYADAIILCTLADASCVTSYEGVHYNLGFKARVNLSCPLTSGSAVCVRGVYHANRAGVSNNVNFIHAATNSLLHFSLR